LLSEAGRHGVAAALSCLLWLATPAAAEVFLSKQEALAVAFPSADRMESRTEVLDDAQQAEVERRSSGPLESRLVTLHTGLRGQRVTGYAFIDVHMVRTLPEALLVVLSPEGEIRNVQVIAFHEPGEYRPTAGWLAQFESRESSADLEVGSEIHGIAGASLSARAVTRSVRRSLSLFDLLVEGTEPGAIPERHQPATESARAGPPSASPAGR
jgi:hypothetical protein